MSPGFLGVAPRADERTATLPGDQLVAAPDVVPAELAGNLLA